MIISFAKMSGKIENGIDNVLLTLNYFVTIMVFVNHHSRLPHDVYLPLKIHYRGTSDEFKKQLDAYSETCPFLFHKK